MVIKLLVIICNKSVWDPISAHDISPDEINCFLLSDVAQAFDSSPLRKVIYCNNNVRCPSLTFWQWSNKGNFPLSKWSWRGHGSKIFRWLGGNIREALAVLTILSFLLHVLMHCWPKIPLS